jgi:hypothetical protein
MGGRNRCPLDDRYSSARAPGLRGDLPGAAHAGGGGAAAAPRRVPVADAGRAARTAGRSAPGPVPPSGGWRQGRKQRKVPGEVGAQHDRVDEVADNAVPVAAGGRYRGRGGRGPPSRAAARPATRSHPPDGAGRAAAPARRRGGKKAEAQRRTLGEVGAPPCLAPQSAVQLVLAPRRRVHLQQIGGQAGMDLLAQLAVARREGRAQGRVAVGEGARRTPQRRAVHGGAEPRGAGNMRRSPCAAALLSRSVEIVSFFGIEAVQVPADTWLRLDERAPWPRWISAGLTAGAEAGLSGVCHGGARPARHYAE